MADLHSLRIPLGTRLAREGIAPQIAQRIMRHADYRTTLKHTHRSACPTTPRHSPGSVLPPLPPPVKGRNRAIRCERVRQRRRPPPRANPLSLRDVATVCGGAPGRTRTCDPRIRNPGTPAASCCCRALARSPFDVPAYSPAVASIFESTDPPRGGHHDDEHAPVTNGG